MQRVETYSTLVVSRQARRKSTRLHLHGIDLPEHHQAGIERAGEHERRDDRAQTDIGWSRAEDPHGRQP